MIIDFKEMSEELAEQVIEVLHETFGYNYDVDFTALYGKHWILAGVRAQGDQVQVVAATIMEVAAELEQGVTFHSKKVRSA